MEIVRLHTPDLSEALTQRLVEVVRMVRALDLKKPPRSPRRSTGRGRSADGCGGHRRETFEQSMSIIVSTARIDLSPTGGDEACRVLRPQS